MVVYVFLMDESSEDEKTVYIQKGKYRSKLNVEEPISDFQFKVNIIEMYLLFQIFNNQKHSFLDWSR